MRREAFERAHGERWTQLLRLYSARKAQARDAAAVRAFPVQYRRVCQDLALARSRRYGADLEERLNRLALQGRDLLYARRGNPLSRVRHYLSEGFPRQVRELSGALAAAVSLFLVPFVAFLVAAWIAPAAIEAVLDPDAMATYESMYDPVAARQAHGRDSASDVSMFGLYIYNNIGIAFRTFAGGVLCGLGSIFFLVYNGVHFGAVAGYLSAEGMGVTLWPFVIGHGAFELTAIVLAGQAGLHLGYALIAPGRRTRGRALRESGRESAMILGGAGLMLVCAAVLEAFWSSSSAPAAVKYGVGALLWTCVLGYLAFGGRARAA
jgi:uncharacterized membrane protein SpoIIM required for sporulation